MLVGMGSFFAGVASAPIGAMLMVAEMTGGYTLLPPLMLVSVVAILLMRRTSIYENQVDGPASNRPRTPPISPLNVLEEMRVADLYSMPPADVLDVSMPERRLPGDSATSILGEPRRDGARGRRRRATLVGLHHRRADPPRDGRDASSTLRRRPRRRGPAGLAVRPEDDLYRAHELFRSSGCPKIPIIDEDGPEDPRRSSACSTTGT